MDPRVQNLLGNQATDFHPAGDPYWQNLKGDINASQPAKDALAKNIKTAEVSLGNKDPAEVPDMTQEKWSNMIGGKVDPRIANLSGNFTPPTIPTSQQPGQGLDLVKQAQMDKAAFDARTAAAIKVASGWGKGLPGAAYNAGGAVTDFLSRFPSLQGAPAAVAGAGTNALIQAAPAVLTSGSGTNALTAEQLSHNALVAQRTAVLNSGRNLGLTVPPSQTNPTLINRLLESIGGKAPTQQVASDINQNAVYGIAQREAGLSPTESINSENLAAARDRISQPYRDIAALPSEGPLSQPPFKSPAATLEDLKDSRANAKDLWNYYTRSMKPEALRAAKDASARSDQLENALEAQASAAGKPELAQQLRDARVALAKNHTVERAMQGSTFNPALLSKLASRGNTPLSGDLETVMQMYRDFPKAMTAPQISGSHGVNQLLPYIGSSGGAVAGAALGGLEGAGLGGMAGMIAGQTVPPLARSLILSKPYQSLMANYKPITQNTPALAPFLAGQPILGALSGQQ